MPVKLYYGTSTFNIDVTNSIVDMFGTGIIHIPSGDINRYMIFRVDPVHGTVKTVFVEDEYSQIHEFDESHEIFIDIECEKIYTQDDVPHELIKKIQRLPRSDISVTYGHFPTDFQCNLISNSYEFRENSLAITYVMKSLASTPLLQENIALDSRFIPNGYNNLISTFTGYKQISSSFWGAHDHKSLNYILRGEIIIDIKKSVNIIEEILSHFSKITSQTVNDLGSTEIWVQVEEPVLEDKVAEKNNKTKRYIRINGRMVLCNE